MHKLQNPVLHQTQVRPNFGLSDSVEPTFIDMHVTSVDCQPSLKPKASPCTGRNACTWTTNAHICQWVPSGKRISNFGPCPVRHEPSVQVSPPEMTISEFFANILITSHKQQLACESTSSLVLQNSFEPQTKKLFKLQLMPLSMLVGNGYLRQGQMAHGTWWALRVPMLQTCCTCLPCCLNLQG